MTHLQRIGDRSLATHERMRSLFAGLLIAGLVSTTAVAQTSRPPSTTTASNSSPTTAILSQTPKTSLTPQQLNAVMSILLPRLQQSRPTLTTITSVATASEDVNYLVNVKVETTLSTPTGNVLFSDGTGSTCMATLSLGSPANTGIGNCNLNTAIPGSRTITATYQGTFDYAASSDTESITVKANQTITIDQPGAQTYAPGGSFAVIANASSGLPVTLGSSTPGICTALGSTATIVSAGTCIITADQAGDGNFVAAPQATRNVVINRAAQSIAFADPSSQTSTPGSVLNLSAVATSGLSVAFASATPSTCTVSAAQATITNTGLCTITANQVGDGNYQAAAQVTRDVNSGRSNQTIAFPPPGTQTYAPTGSFSVVVSGGASGNSVSVASSTPSVCSVASTTVTIVGAGTCTLTATQPGNANFNPAPAVTHDVTISRATQVISIDEPGAQYFAPHRPFQVTATARSGSAATGLPVAFSAREQCTVTGNTFTLLDRGTCTFVATQDGNGNYQAAPAATRSIPISISTTVTGTSVVETTAPSSDRTGRYLAYQSSGNDSDIFRLDTLTLAKTRIDLDNGGLPINGASMEPSLSGDGQFVVFVAPNTGTINLKDESKAARDQRHKQGGFIVVLRNLINGTAQHVGNALPTGTNTTPVFSAQGNSIVFTGMSGGHENVFKVPLRRTGDTLTPDTTVCVSCKAVDAAGTNTGIDANGDSRNAVVSGDGNWVAWETEAKNLLAGQTDPCPVAASQIMLRNLITGVSQRIAAPTAAQCTAGGSRKPSMDHGAKLIAFESDLPLSNGDSNVQADAFLATVGGGTPLRLSESVDGAQSAMPSSAPVISGDGSTVAFVSAATNLDPFSPDSGSTADVHIAVLNRGRINRSRLTREKSGQIGDADTARPALSYSGTKLMFDSTGGNLATGVGTGTRRVFQQATPDNLDKIFSASFD